MVSKVQAPTRCNLRGAAIYRKLLRELDHRQHRDSFIVAVEKDLASAACGYEQKVSARVYQLDSEMNVPNKWLVFDLGGVLFDFEGVTGVSAITGLTTDAAHQALVSSDAIRDLETGRIADHDFGKRFAEELGVSLTSDEMLALWSSWEAGPKPGAIPLLKQLNRRGNLACLTNNNAIHWKRLSTEYSVHTFFDRCFLSHEIGLHKPDPRIFRHLISELNVEPAEITYFDDREDIVVSAKNCGLNAYQAISPQEIEDLLGRL